MNSGSNANNNEKGVEVRTHDIPIADAMTEFMKEGWAPSPLEGVTPHKSIPFTTARREVLSKKYPGVTISDLKKWNDISGEELKPGMKLKISG